MLLIKSFSLLLQIERNRTIHTCKNVHRFNAERELAFQKYIHARYTLKITNIASQNISSQNMFVMLFLFPTRMLFQKQISV